MRIGLHWREFLLLLVAVDAVVVIVVTTATARLWDAVWPSFVPTPLFELWLLATWPVWMFALTAGGAYDLLTSRDARGQVGAAARALAIVLALTGIAYFFLPRSFPRSVALAAPLAVLVVLLVWRLAVLPRLLNWAPLQRRIVIVGLDETTTRLASVLLGKERVVPYEVVAFLADGADVPAKVLGIPVRRAERMWDFVRAAGVQEIAVGRREAADADRQAELVECFYAGVAATDARRLYEELTGRVMIEHVGPNWYVELPTLPRRPYFAVKRAIDVAGALVIGVVLLPLIAVTALLVFLDDGRDVLYRQERLGRRGEAFTVHKFRTMRRDAERGGPRYAERRDPRSTRLGGFLRPSGLDELPQLWDVLRGKMSLVGPRPERAEFVAQLAAEVPLYRARLLVRPGVVGWAEVHVPHAGSLRDHLLRLEYDLYYLQRANFLLDLNVALRAVGLVLGGQRWGRAPTTDSLSGAPQRISSSS